MKGYFCRSSFLNKLSNLLIVASDCYKINGAKICKNYEKLLVRLPYGLPKPDIKYKCLPERVWQALNIFCDTKLYNLLNTITPVVGVPIPVRSIATVIFISLSA